MQLLLHNNFKCLKFKKYIQFLWAKWAEPINYMQKVCAGFEIQA